MADDSRARVVKPGGIVIVIAPSSGAEHRYPTDCWRFYPDGMRALCKWAELECLHASTAWHESMLFMWGDTIGVFHKPGPSIKLDLAGIKRRQLGSKFRERYIDAGLLLQGLHRRIGKMLSLRSS